MEDVQAATSKDPGATKGHGTELIIGFYNGENNRKILNLRQSIG